MLAQGKTLKFAGLFSSFCSVFKEGKRCWPTDTKQKKKNVGQQIHIISFTFSFFTEKCRNSFSKKKNKHFSWSYSLPVGMFKTKNKR